MANETILVVEDELFIGEELREDLERSGYRVPAVVPSGDGVAEAVAQHHPAVVLMDIRLGGGMDGIQAAAALKARFDVPVIYLTAFSDPETLERAAATEPAAYLIKPFSERELLANVALALSKRKASEAAPISPDPILDTLGLPSLLISQEGKIEYANGAALTLLGVRSLQALRGQSLDVFLKEQRPGDDRRLLVANDGSESSVIVRTERMKTPDGKPRGTLTVIDRMSSEERLHLEHSAGQATDAMLSLLPEADAAGAGYQVSGFLLASPSGSGDLYDVFSLDDEHFAFYGLDVMGHGVLQSLFAFSLHDVIRLIASSRIGIELPRPSEVVRALNDRYSAGSELTPFFSLLYGVVERETGRYSFVRAGHPPLIQIPSRGEPSLVSERGSSALGAFPGISFTEISGSLLPGDRLIICSDGLLEGASGDVGVGIGEFLRVAEIGKALEARVFASSVKASILARRRTPVGLQRFQDDSSMLVIERDPR